jgi:Fe-S cluster assembly iron-binding protein IscA
MLTLTHAAVAVIRDLVSASELEDGGGLRISARSEEDGGYGLHLALAQLPEDADRVVSDRDANVFLSPEAASLLDDFTLDAEVDDEGGVEFRLRRR